ncbi:MAG: SagB/ThcOx family dehydrogenase [Terriglobales bacterium]
MELLARTNLKLLSAAMVAARELFHGTRAAASAEEPTEALVKIALPAPELAGRMPLEEALAQRRSLREFSAQPLSYEELSQLLWAAQGITAPDGRRTAPSAGALYALEVYVATSDGFYHYVPAAHELEVRSEEDLRPTLYWAAQCRGFLRDAAAVFVITAVYERIEHRYGRERSPLYVHLEAGHAAQNLLLQAVSLGLGGVPVGGFYDDQVKMALPLRPKEWPVYLIGIGHPGGPLPPPPSVSIS